MTDPTVSEACEYANLIADICKLNAYRQPEATAITPAAALVAAWLRAHP